MMLEIVWRPAGQRKPTKIPVAAAWPVGSWICYRKHGSPDTTHLIPESAVDEILMTTGPSDPDPMRPA